MLRPADGQRDPTVVVDSCCAWRAHEISRHEEHLAVTRPCADHVASYAGVVNSIDRSQPRRAPGRVQFDAINPVSSAWVYDPSTPGEEGHLVPLSEFRLMFPPPHDPRPFTRRRQAWRMAELSGAAPPELRPPSWQAPPSVDLDSIPTGTPTPPSASPDRSRTAAVTAAHAYRTTVTRAECMTSHADNTGVTLERDFHETELTVVSGHLNHSARSCDVLIDGGSMADLIDSSTHQPRELAAAGIRVEPVRLCLVGITGKGPTQTVHVAHEVPVLVPGAGVKIIPKAYITDLSHLHASVLIGKPTLARWGAIEDHANGTVTFPDGEWRSSAPDPESTWCHYGGIETVTSAAAASLLRENSGYEIIEVRLDELRAEANVVRTEAEVDDHQSPAPPTSVATKAAQRWASSEETVRQAVLDRFSAMDPELAVFLQQYSCVTTVCQMPPFDPCNTPAAAQHRVRIKPGQESHLRRAPVYPMSRVERDEMRKQLDYLLRRGLIQPSAENSASPAFFIRKRAGAGEKTGTTKLRLIIDMRNLNENCYRDATPLPSVADIFNEIGNGNKYFSNLDLIHAYWNCAVEPDSQKFLAFNTPHGQYSWRVLPFGASNAPATFTRFLKQFVLKDIPHVSVYLDDIVIATKTKAEHLRILALVLDRMELYHLPINLLKSSFLTSSTKVLGHIIDEHGKSACPEQIVAIRKLPPPTSFKELRSVVGVYQYYSEWIVNFADIAAPLMAIRNRTIRSEWTKHWTTECVDAFTTLRDALAQLPTLHLPDPNKPFYLAADASKTAIGSTLLQPYTSSSGKVTLMPVGYRSRILRAGERSKPIFYLELLAVVDGLKFWEGPLSFQHVHIISDHAPLQWIATQEKVTHATANVIDFLSRFSFDWSHVKGADLERLPPDLLSRPAGAVIQYQPGSDFLHPDGTLRNTNNGEMFSDFVDPAADHLMSTTVVQPTVHVTCAVGADPTTFKSEPTGLSPTAIAAGYSMDPLFGRVHHDLTHPAENPQSAVHRRYLIDDNGLVHQRMYGTNRLRICIPKRSVSDLLRWFHSGAVVANHIGGKGLYVRIRQQFYFGGGMEQACRRFCRSCARCQLAKPGNARVNHPAQPSLPVALPGQRLFMDFADLPTGADHRGNLYDYGLVVRDGATGYIFIIPCTKEVDAEETAQLLLDWVFPTVGFPNAIFSDRDVRFGAKVWLAFAALLGMDLHKSTAHHPQTDGGGESAVKDIVLSLRLWANTMGNNWVRNRAILQMAINTRPGDTRGGKTAYDQLMGFTPRTNLDYQLECIGLTPATVTHDRLAELSTARAAANDALHQAAIKSLNRPHGKPIHISAGDLVLVHRLALKNPADHTHRPHKLSLLYRGPFKVIKVTASTATVALPPGHRAHPTFNRDMIRVWEGPPLEDPGADGTFTVHHIISSQLKPKQQHQQWRRQFLVSWDANGAQTTYEPRDSFIDPATGEITAALVEFELARTRDLFGCGQLDTLTADWLCHHGGPRGTTLAQADGTTTYKCHGNDTVTTIARRLRAVPRLTANSLLAANVYKLSRAGKAPTPLTGNTSHGLTLTSKLKVDTILRLPRWEA